MAIISLSGKKQSGKDTTGKIIQSFLNGDKSEKILEIIINGWQTYCEGDKWEIKKFADALKDIVCILTGCTREQLEDETFKNSYLNENWSLPTNIKVDFNTKLTYRILLQFLGTNLLRNQLHQNVWVNALFSKYKVLNDELRSSMGNIIDYSKCPFPNWIITDCRFPNEAEAIKKRNGILIRINRFGLETNDHESETSLDDYKFDYVIDNNGTIEELIEKTKEILIKENLIKS